MPIDSAHVLSIEYLRILFVNRQDQYLQTAGDSWRWSSEPLTRDIIQDHLEGDITIGVPELDRNGLTKFVAVDIDGPDHAVDTIDDKVQRLKDTVASANKLLQQAILFVHTGNGVHVFMFFDQKAPGSALKEHFLVPLLERAGFHVQGDLFFDGDTKLGEIFPRKDSLAEGETGYAIRLPLGKHQNGNWSTIMHDKELDDIVPVRLGQELLDAFREELETQPERQYDPHPDWHPPEDTEPLPACIAALMQRGSVHDGSHQNNLDLVQALLVSGYAIDDIHEVFAQMDGYRYATTEYQANYTLKQIRNGVLPLRTYKCETYLNDVHGLECYESECPRKNETKEQLGTNLPDIRDFVDIDKYQSFFAKPTPPPHKYSFPEIAQNISACKNMKAYDR